MTTIVLDQSLANKLRECKGMAVLRDSDGRVVGYFEPPGRHVYQEGEIPEFNEDEMDRRVARWEGIPSEEVRRRLLERK
jgi:hypothetical protein